MYSDFDNTIAYEWQDADEYPHRSQAPDTLERTIAFSRNGAQISVADARFAVAPAVLVETMIRLRRVCLTIHGAFRRES